MANLKISQLPSVVSATSSDILAIVQAGVTSQIPISDILSLVPSASFSGNTSGDCISDIYVSNVHSCSPISFYEGDTMIGSFDASNGFALVDGVDIKLGVNSRIVDSNDMVIVDTAGVSNLEFAANGFTGKLSNEWVDGPVLNTTVSGTSSATTATTRFQTSYDVTAGAMNTLALYNTESYNKSVNATGSGCGAACDDSFDCDTANGERCVNGCCVKSAGIVETFNNGNESYSKSVSATGSGCGAACDDSFDCDTANGETCVDGCCVKGAGIVETFNDGVNVINVTDLANSNVYTHTVLGTQSGTTGETKFQTSYNVNDGAVEYSVYNMADNTSYMTKASASAGSGCSACDDDFDCDTANGERCIDGCCVKGTGTIATFNTGINVIEVADLANDNVYVHSVMNVSGSSSGTTGQTIYQTSYDVNDGIKSVDVINNGINKFKRSAGSNKVDAADLFFAINGGVDGLNVDIEPCKCDPAEFSALKGDACTPCAGAGVVDFVNIDSYINDEGNAAIYNMNSATSDEGVISNIKLHSSFAHKVINNTKFDSLGMVDDKIISDKNGWIKSSDCSWLNGDAEFINTMSATGGTSGLTATTTFIETNNLTTGIKTVDVVDNLGNTKVKSTYDGFRSQFTYTIGDNEKLKLDGVGLTVEDKITSTAGILNLATLSGGHIPTSNGDATGSAGNVVTDGIYLYVHGGASGWGRLVLDFGF